MGLRYESGSTNWARSQFDKGNVILQRRTISRTAPHAVPATPQLSSGRNTLRLPECGKSPAWPGLAEAEPGGCREGAPVYLITRGITAPCSTEVQPLLPGSRRPPGQAGLSSSSLPAWRRAEVPPLKDDRTLQEYFFGNKM